MQNPNAGVAELADASDSKSDGVHPCEGSTPSSGTSPLNPKIKSRQIREKNSARDYVVIIIGKGLLQLPGAGGVFPLTTVIFYL